MNTWNWFGLTMVWCLAAGITVFAQEGGKAGEPEVAIGAVPSNAGLPALNRDYENSLGMKFKPVPGTFCLFSIWETRVRDFETFVQTSGYNATQEIGTVIYSRGVPRRTDTWRNPGFDQGRDHPVCDVCWMDAQAFCRWLTEKERDEGRLLAGWRYRLPTDAEWSAAMGVSSESGWTPEERKAHMSNLYPWGKAWPPPKGVGNLAGEELLKVPSNQFAVIVGFNDGYARTSPVGSFNATRHGLYDLEGNLFEWVQDFFEEGERTRTFRGGSWAMSDPKMLLASWRGNHHAESRYPWFGFRCVLSDRAPADQ